MAKKKIGSVNLGSHINVKLTSLFKRFCEQRNGNVISRFKMAKRSVLMASLLFLRKMWKSLLIHTRQWQEYVFPLKD